MDTWKTLRSATSQCQLKQTFEEHVRQTGTKGRDNLTPQAFADTAESRGEWRTLSHRLRDGSYVFSPYRLTLISRGREKTPREISIPSVRDRIALRTLAEVLQKVFQDRRTPVAQQHVSSIRKDLESQSYTHFLRLDVKDFYPSINHEKLMDEIRKRTRSAAVQELVKSAITTPTLATQQSSRGELRQAGVPQGIAVSNILAEVAMTSLDAELEVDNCSTYRYIDDILILGDFEAIHKLHDDCKSIFRKYGLCIHDFSAKSSSSSKAGCGRIDEGFQFLGYEFKGGVVRAKAASVSRLENSLARACTRSMYDQKKLDRHSTPGDRDLVRFRGKWFLDLVITGCIFEEHRRGWLCYYSQIDDRSQLKKLDAIVGRLTRRMGLDLGPKSFVKAHRALRSRAISSSYIPNFDQSTREEQVEILVKCYRENSSNLQTKSDDQVAHEFRRRLSGTLRTMETDIAGASR